MVNGVSMRCSLTTEIPSLHDSLEPFTLAGSLDIHKLSQREMTSTQEKSHRQEILRGYLKLGNVALRRKTKLQKVSSLGLLEFFEISSSRSNLNGVDSVLLFSFYLSDLAPVHLQDCARHDFTPLIPVMSHAHLVSNETSSFGVSVNGLSFLDF
jgi:hypothetical protein